MKKYFLLIIALGFIYGFGQINPKTRWGNVSEEEINLKQLSFDSDAAAVILYEEGSTETENSFETKIYRRIKILNEKGLDAANVEIRYYNYKDMEKVQGIRAQTINYENGKQVTSPVDKNAIFDTELNEYWSVKKFAFPNVKVGSIIEYEYKTIDQRYYIDAWRFQHKYPTVYSSYDFKNLSSVDFTTVVIGDEVVRYSAGKQSSGLRKWELKNIPSYLNIPFVYNPIDISERVVFQLKGYLKRGGSLNSQTKYQSVMNEWSALNRDMLNLYSKYTSNSVGKEIAEQIPEGENETETIRNIYSFFKKNYNWNKVYGIYPQNSNRDVSKNKTGNSADLNLLLHSILKGKNFESDLILISTRDNAKLAVSYPYIGQFNSLVNLIRTKDGNSFLIDASDLNFDLGYAPLKNFNYFGLIVDPINENMIQLNPPLSVYQSVQNYVFKDDKFMLSRIDKRNGYFKQQNNKIPAGIQKYNPVKNSLDLVTNELNTQSKDNDDEYFQLERTNSETTKIAAANFISVENPLKKIVLDYKLTETTRERALEYDFPFLYKTDISIDIPPGYKAEIPAGFNVQKTADGGNMNFIQAAEIKDTKILIHTEFYMGKSIYNDKFPEIKTFFDNTIEATNKSVLLKKN